jgi:hypothetical protein
MNMGKQKPDKKEVKSKTEVPWKMPDYVLHQLNEQTVGGYAIFYFRPDDGTIEHRMHFDSPSHAMAMQKYIEDYAEIAHSFNIQNTLNALLDNNSSEEE